jgi:DNA-binding protein YbaB
MPNIEEIMKMAQEAQNTLMQEQAKLTRSRSKAPPAAAW